MLMLDIVKLKSKDPSTKVSAIIVGKNNEILSTGFNGFPIGVNEEIETRWTNRELKYKMVVHAEENAIALAARHGQSLNGSRIYVSKLPCSGCAKLIIQSGIIEVIITKPKTKEDNDFYARWKEDLIVSKTMLEESKVKITII
jgi:dCMP deaminase